MGHSRELTELHDEGLIILRVSQKVLDELEAHLKNVAKAGMAAGALRRIRQLHLTTIYWPRPRLGEGRVSEIRLSDPGLFHEKGFKGGDTEIAEFAAAGHVDFAKQGKVRYFVTDDQGILQRRTIIKAEVAGLDVLSYGEFLSIIRPHQSQ
jgi:predicted nucleic acid-binding protein